MLTVEFELLRRRRARFFRFLLVLTNECASLMLGLVANVALFLKC